MKEKKERPTHIFKNGKVQPIEPLKQTSWFKTDKNIEFENSFKFWFALQWQNKYMQIFLVTFTLTIIGLLKINSVIDIVDSNYIDEGWLGASFAIAGFSIPPIVSIVVAYKGFWQYFNDLKNGISR